ncbi:conserved hypothetical protein with DGPF domain (modular protein) [Bradyrhizobium sp. ORS 278]|nr:conserved hypothetical protein with DGPF domain (modular protein) [Bradyrhizobium sp. ORS 278]
MDHQGGVARSGHRSHDARAVPERPGGDPADLCGGGFWRGADARVARAGGSAARAGVEQLTRRPIRTGADTMRFMMLMIPLGYESAPPDVRLDPERVAAMMRYNEALKDAGVLITLEGLHPPSMGARVSFPGGRPVVTDGPFAEAKEVLGGYWMIEVGSREEAVAWAKRCPASENEIIEIRQVQEMSDFSEEVQQAAAGFSELPHAGRA